ncbi:HNH endonuclease [Candidatus Pacearchaeota archaeon]|nr:HNH endonuclease [Candidatus Pacearchaeota archaeon]
MERVILLNNDYSYLNTISWKKAICLMFKGKVEVVKATNTVITNAERTCEIMVPKIIRLFRLVRSIYKAKVPFSKRNILFRDQFTCQYCGVKKKKLTIDHVMPTSRGGKSTFENCVASCETCNHGKSDRLPREAKMFLRRQPHQPTIMEFIRIEMKILGIDKMLEELFA